MMVAMISLTSFAQFGGGQGQRREIKPEDQATRRADQVKEAAKTTDEQYKKVYDLFLKQAQEQQARMKEAQEKAQRDSERLIREKKEESLNRRTAILATKTQEGQKKLFIERNKMVDEIFRDAFDKLVAYAVSDAYEKKLLESAKEIAKLFDGKACVLYVKEYDLGCFLTVLSSVTVSGISRRNRD